MFLVTQGFGESSLGIVSVTSFATYLLVVFDQDIVLNGDALNPAKYLISGPTPVTVSAAEIDAPGNVLKLTVNDQQTNGTYTLNFPYGIQDVFGSGLLVSSAQFTGLHTAPSIQIARSVDERTLEVVFDRAVLQTDAQDPTKYTINLGLAVLASVRVTDITYRLTTTPQTINANYQVSASGIHDIFGN